MPEHDSTTAAVMDEVADERRRQHEKWGEQNHPSERPGAWWSGDPGMPARSRGCADLEIPSEARARGRCAIEAHRGLLTWGDILVEEVSEAIATAHDPAALRAELIQVAAVAVAWVECIDRAEEVPRG